MTDAAWMVQYHQRILALDPIAYWLQDERWGTVSYDWVRRRQGSDQDGAYTGVTLGRPGIGDGRTSPFFDGVNDFNNVFTATLQGRFSGTEGTMMAWARVANSGVWIDGAIRTVMILRAGGPNQVVLYRSNVNNRFTFYYAAGGVVEQRDVNGLTTTDWMHLAITWSVSAGATGEVRAYLNGVQQGATMVALGVWVGLLNAATTAIGAGNIAPATIWHGYIGHCAVWDRALTPNEILEEYRKAFS